MLKKILNLSVLVFLFTVIPVFGQTSDNVTVTVDSVPQVENQVQTNDEKSDQTQAYSLGADPSKINLGDTESQDDSSSSKSSSTVLSSIWLLVKMIFVLALVIVCIYFVIYFMKRSTKISDTDDPFLRQVSKITLSPGKSVQIVTVLEHAYLIGVSDNSINLIGQIDDKELVDSMNIFADKNNNSKRPKSFADILDLFMPKGPRSSNVYGSSAQNMADSLKKQRDRFNNQTGE